MGKPNGDSDDPPPRPPSLAVPPSGPVTAHAVRLRPGESLMSSLRDAAEVILGRTSSPGRPSAVFVMTAVGSLEDATLRLANASRRDGGGGGYGEKEEGGRGGEVDDSIAGRSLTPGRRGGNDVRRWRERFEIVSLVGTFSRGGGCHLHVSLSDADGRTVGGHLIDGIVFTTVEAVLGTIGGVEFRRVEDEETGFRELVPMQLPDDDDGECGWLRRRGWGDIVGIILTAAVGSAIGAALSPRRK